MNFVKNEILNAWILWKMRFWKCEFCEKWDFKIVNFGKIENFKMWFLDKMRIFATVYWDTFPSLFLESKNIGKYWTTVQSSAWKEELFRILIELVSHSAPLALLSAAFIPKSFHLFCQGSFFFFLPRFSKIISLQKAAKVVHYLPSLVLECHLSELPMPSDARLFSCDGDIKKNGFPSILTPLMDLSWRQKWGYPKHPLCWLFWVVSVLLHGKSNMIQNAFYFYNLSVLTRC